VLLTGGKTKTLVALQQLRLDMAFLQMHTVVTMEQLHQPI